MSRIWLRFYDLRDGHYLSGGFVFQNPLGNERVHPRKVPGAARDVAIRLDASLRSRGNPRLLLVVGLSTLCGRVSKLWKTFPFPQLPLVAGRLGNGCAAQWTTTSATRRAASLAIGKRRMRLRITAGTIALLDPRSQSERANPTPALRSASARCTAVGPLGPDHYSDVL